jgi:hypothetical protein
MVLYETRFLHIVHNSDTGILQCVWTGYQTEEGIKEAGQAIINIIKEKGVKKILNDNQLVKGSWKEVAGWVNEDWFPAIMEAGVTRFAWVYSKDVFARYSARKAAGNTKIIKLFSKVEDAKQWLEVG